MSNEALTKQDLLEFAQGPLREVIRSELTEFSGGPLRTIIHEELGEFTEQVLLPAVERIVDDKITQANGKLRSDLIDYVDRRVGAATGDIIATIKGDRERDRTFKAKVLDIVRRNKLAREDELLILEETLP